MGGRLASRIVPVILGAAGVAAAFLAAQPGDGGAATNYKATLPLVARDAPFPTPTAFPTIPATATGIPPTPTATSVPIPAGISIRKSTSYVNSIGTLHIVGEVLNGLPAAAQYVEITANLYSSGGTLLATDFTFSEISVIPAGGTSPFDLLVLDPPAGASRYTLQVTDYKSPPYSGSTPVTGLTATVTNIYTSSIGTLHIVGTVRNNSAKTYTYVEPIVALYNAAGDVVRVDFTFTKPDTLGAGQTGTFDLLIFGADEFSYSSYQIWVDAND